MMGCSYQLLGKRRGSGLQRSRGMTLAVAIVAVALLGSGGSEPSSEEEFALPSIDQSFALPTREPKFRNPRPYPSRPLPADEEARLIPPPPIDDEYFPCNDCHEGEPADPRERELDEHEAIKLAHGDLWCLDCHQSDQRDLLHLSDRSPIQMEESWRLCTRCHAKRIPDWRAGVHGKRVGNWVGAKEYFTCVECHDPHSPLFKPLAPKPPPKPVSGMKLRSLIIFDQVELEEVQHEEK
jgi:hypothetical protein